MADKKIIVSEPFIQSKEFRDMLDRWSKEKKEKGEKDNIEIEIIPQQKKPKEKPQKRSDPRRYLAGERGKSILDLTGEKIKQHLKENPEDAGKNFFELLEKIKDKPEKAPKKSIEQNISELQDIKEQYDPSKVLASAQDDPAMLVGVAQQQQFEAPGGGGAQPKPKPEPEQQRSASDYLPEDLKKQLDTPVPNVNVDPNLPKRAPIQQKKPAPKPKEQDVPVDSRMTNQFFPDILQQQLAPERKQIPQPGTFQNEEEYHKWAREQQQIGEEMKRRKEYKRRFEESSDLGNLIRPTLQEGLDKQKSELEAEAFRQGENLRRETEALGRNIKQEPGSTVDQKYTKEGFLEDTPTQLRQRQQTFTQGLLTGDTIPKDKGIEHKTLTRSKYTTPKTPPTVVGQDVGDQPEVTEIPEGKDIKGYIPSTKIQPGAGIVALKPVFDKDGNAVIDPKTGKQVMEKQNIFDIEKQAVKDLVGALDEQAEAQEELGEELSLMEKEKAKAYEEAANEAEERKQAYDKIMERSDKATNEIMEQIERITDEMGKEIDPHRFFRDMSVPKKMLASLSIFMAGRGGDSNEMVDYFETMIGKDIEAQIADKEALIKSGTVIGNMFNSIIAAGGTEIGALAGLAKLQLDHLDMMINLAEANFRASDPVLQDKLAAMKVLLAQNKLKIFKPLADELRQHIFNKGRLRYEQDKYNQQRDDEINRRNIEALNKARADQRAVEREAESIRLLEQNRREILYWKEVERTRELNVKEKQRVKELNEQNRILIEQFNKQYDLNYMKQQAKARGAGTGAGGPLSLKDRLRINEEIRKQKEEQRKEEELKVTVGNLNPPFSSRDARKQGKIIFRAKSVDDAKAVTQGMIEAKKTLRNINKIIAINDYLKANPGKRFFRPTLNKLTALIDATSKMRYRIEITGGGNVSVFEQYMLQAFAPFSEIIKTKDAVFINVDKDSVRQWLTGGLKADVIAKTQFDDSINAIIDLIKTSAVTENQNDLDANLTAETLLNQLEDTKYRLVITGDKLENQRPEFIKIQRGRPKPVSKEEVRQKRKDIKETLEFDRALEEAGGQKGVPMPKLKE